MRWFDVENRSVSILHLLEQKQKVTNDILVEKLKVSLKTIQNDIRQLNGTLRGVAVIEGRHGAYKLYILNEERYRRARSDLEMQNACFEVPQMRMSFIIDTLMHCDQPYLIDELAYAMSIGRSTILADIKKLKKILALHNLSIVGKTNSGIYLKGEELNLRFFVLENNFNVIYDKDFLDKDIVEAIRGQAAAWHLDAMTIDFFLKFLTITLDRAFNNHPVTFQDQKYQELLKNPCYSMVEQITAHIGSKLSISFPVEEKIFLTIPFSGMRTPYDISGVENHVDVSDEVLEMVEEIMCRIRQETGLTVKIGNEGALEEFIYHIYFMTNRLRYGIHLHNPMVSSMKEKFSVAYRVAAMAGQVIEEKLGTPLAEDEIGFLAAYFEIFLSERAEAASVAYRVAVICGTGRATARLVMKQLRRVFDSNTDLVICNDDASLGGKTLDTFDLVVSTVSADYDTTTPVILVDEIFDEESLRKNIDRVRHTKKLNIPLIRGVESVLLSLLDEDTFFVLNPEKDYQDNVHDMIDVLTKRGLVDDAFKKRIDEREAKSTMVFDEEVAFPHGYQTCSGKTVVCVGVFPQTMKTGENNALKIIFLVALPQGKEDDIVLVQVYDEIIAISSDKKLVRDLSQIKNYHDFLMYFIKSCDLFG
ncbi:MAG: PRD domain-containing protein [Eubacteriaceae bacterium]|nr:PRD domain-containing protein [Eubacteriaceae bacterium]